jgi:hypothetical protein
LHLPKAARQRRQSANTFDILYEKKEVPMSLYSLFSISISTVVLALLLGACAVADEQGKSNRDKTAPTILSTFPSTGATAVSRNANVIARFSEAMRVSTIIAANFIVTGPGVTPVSGTVSYDAVNHVADFLPSTLLAASTLFTATVTSGVRDLEGNAMAVPYTWTFTTGTTADTTPPTVTFVDPANMSIGVPTNQVITATFSEQVDSATVTTSSFTVTEGAITPVAGTVSCPGSTASFTPTSGLAPGTTFTARITTAATDLAGLAITSDYVWTFATGANAAAGPKSVVLGTAANYVIIAKSTVTTTGVTSIGGDIGLSPAAASFFTGFGQTLDGSGQFSTSTYCTGRLFASDYTPPTPSNMTTAVLDMQTAYTDAENRTNPTATNLGAGNINGMTLAPGLYKWTTGLNIPSAVTLSGAANDVWIFQVAQNLTVGNGCIVTLAGGALAKNVVWQVAGQCTFGTTSNFKGIVLCKTLIAFNNGAVLTGRALSQTAVTMNATTITAP